MKNTLTNNKAKKKIIDDMIRVNQAGELGAQKIYSAQKKVFEFLGKHDDVKEISRMAEEEQEHLDYFNDERSEITLRDLLDMSSGLDFPSHEHEKMFFQEDHLAYAHNVGVEKEEGLKFEYNNVNSMLLVDV